MPIGRKDPSLHILMKSSMQIRTSCLSRDQSRQNGFLIFTYQKGTRRRWRWEVQRDLPGLDGNIAQEFPQRTDVWGITNNFLTHCPSNQTRRELQSYYIQALFNKCVCLGNTPIDQQSQLKRRLYDIFQIPRDLKDTAWRTWVLKPSKDNLDRNRIVISIMYL